MWRNQGHSDWDYFGPGEVGILGSDVPATGTHGAGLLDNEQCSPDRYYRVEIVTSPSSGTLTVERNSSGMLEGAAAGSYTSTYYVWENAVKLQDADNVAIATFNLGWWSSPDGIASTVDFGVPSYSFSSFDQTSTPDGIASTLVFGVPTAYLSDGLQTSSPTGIASTLAIGTPSYTLTNQGWTNVPGPSSAWIDVNDPDSTWTEI